MSLGQPPETPDEHSPKHEDKMKDLNLSKKSFKSKNPQSPAGTSPVTAQAVSQAKVTSTEPSEPVQAQKIKISNFEGSNIPYKFQDPKELAEERSKYLDQIAYQKYHRELIERLGLLNFKIDPSLSLEELIRTLPKLFKEKKVL